MSVGNSIKKKAFDIAKKSKVFRIAFRSTRDAVYRVQMILDDPFASTDDKLIYFQTFSGRGYSDSPKAIYEYMLNNPKYDDFHFVWSFKDPEKYTEIPALQNDRTVLVRFRTSADNKALRKAKYWITNYRMLNHQFPKKDQIYVQCWHGTPLKRLGYDIQEGDNVMNSASEVREKYRTDARRFSYLLSPSPFASEKFATAWNLKETGQTDKILEVGYPRNDRLVKTTDDEREEIRKTLDIPADKKAILYAPTWRDNQHTSGTGYTYKTEVDFDRLQNELGDDYIILFRAHYLVANSFDFAHFKGFIKDVSSYDDINDLYIASDILVTDYSSVFFDYANLKKPIIFYMYDLDYYASELRGFYLSLDELPGAIVREESALIEAIEQTSVWQPDLKYEKFHNRFNPLDDGQASKRLLEAIL